MNGSTEEFDFLEAIGIPVETRKESKSKVIEERAKVILGTTTHSDNEEIIKRVAEDLERARNQKDKNGNSNVDYSTIVAYSWASSVEVMRMILQCDSPIEKIFCGAFLHYVWEVKNINHYELYLKPQSRPNAKANKETRVDFELCSPTNNDCYKRIIIECDGKAFHTSDEQYKKDRERQDLLELQNSISIRFTGSQIYSDAMHCVMETLKKCDEIRGTNYSKK